MKTSVRITDDLYGRLHRHLFQKDGDEHGALILAGVSDHQGELRLLAREIVLADGQDFGPGRHGYRQFSPRLVAEIAGDAGARGLAYLSAHNHPGATSSVGFSADDIDAHERLFPHLLDLTSGGPVGGLVFGEQSVAGDIWLADGTRRPLDEAVIVGAELLRLTPRAERCAQGVPERFDRQARLFGAEGQARLAGLRVGVIGGGGGGSLIVQQLAHLGVGALTIVDFDHISESNLSRVVGATSADVRQRVAKTAILARLVDAIDPHVTVRVVDGDIADSDVAEALLDCDFLFLATDTVRARLVFNAIVHRYLIPGVQLGAKVEVDNRGAIETVYVAVRPAFPSRGCLDCAGLIDPFQLQREQRTVEEAAAQNYIGAPGRDEVIDPSVISLNSVSAGHAVTTMLLSVTGLLEEDGLAHRLFFLRDGSALPISGRKREDCRYCGREDSSHFALGDPVTALPVRRRPRMELAAADAGLLTRVRRLARWRPRTGSFS